MRRVSCFEMCVGVGEMGMVNGGSFCSGGRRLGREARRGGNTLYSIHIGTRRRHWLALRVPRQAKGRTD